MIPKSCLSQHLSARRSTPIIRAASLSEYLFMVGHAAPEQTRKEMVDWLKARYPRVKILALNPADHRHLAGADYNTILNGPGEWLSIVTATLS